MWTCSRALEATEAQQSQLRQWVRNGTTQQRVAFRCHIVLRAIAGESNNAIAKSLLTSRPTVILWRQRFAEGGCEALLRDLPRGQRIPPLPRKKVQEVVEKTLHEKPTAATHWSCRSMAKVSGISSSAVQKIWNAH